MGVERTFPVHSPKIERIEVAARGDVRRAKLYYLRDRVGRGARVRERRWTGAEEAYEAGAMPPETRRARARRSWARSGPRPTRPRPHRPPRPSAGGRGAEQDAPRGGCAEAEPADEAPAEPEAEADEPAEAAAEDEDAAPEEDAAEEPDDADGDSEDKPSG